MWSARGVGAKPLSAKAAARHFRQRSELRQRAAADARRFAARAPPEPSPDALSTLEARAGDIVKRLRSRSPPPRRPAAAAAPARFNPALKPQLPVAARGRSRSPSRSPRRLRDAGRAPPVELGGERASDDDDSGESEGEDEGAADWGRPRRPRPRARPPDDPIRVLCHSELFAPLAAGESIELLRFCALRQFASGEALARAGCVSAGLFVVLRGAVAVAGARRVPGDTVCEAALRDAPCAADAVADDADTPTRCLLLSRGAFHRVWAESLPGSALRGLLEKLLARAKACSAPSLAAAAATATASSWGSSMASSVATATPPPAPAAPEAPAAPPEDAEEEAAAAASFEARRQELRAEIDTLHARHATERVGAKREVILQRIRALEEMLVEVGKSEALAAAYRAKRRARRQRQAAPASASAPAPAPESDPDGKLALAAQRAAIVSSWQSLRPGRSPREASPVRSVAVPAAPAAPRVQPAPPPVKTAVKTAPPPPPTPPPPPPPEEEEVSPTSPTKRWCEVSGRLLPENVPRDLTGPAIAKLAPLPPPAALSLTHTRTRTPLTPRSPTARSPTSRRRRRLQQGKALTPRGRGSARRAAPPRRALSAGPSAEPRTPRSALAPRDERAERLVDRHAGGSARPVWDDDTAVGRVSEINTRALRADRVCLGCLRRVPRVRSETDDRFFCLECAVAAGGLWSANGRVMRLGE